ncbi:hypothetical protein C3B51_14230 [Pseudoalteromonas rubra]|uniref:Zinc ribbon-containing protein n=1 Tax=Pseudoalteromonas rubra TaxID=43658 RepID=A0A4Q7E893_9GAMM|nr:hypothetical protein [Pseudoalteromonas rubra]RZM78515.1 hypothetical protein C3B51_14230 [Pseudoalteromonas rubra]
MADYKRWLDDFSVWLKDVKEHELKKLVKEFMDAQEAVKQLSKDKLADYRYYLKRDLAHLSEHKDHYDDVAWEELKASVMYELAQLEDRTQLEWQALVQDFQHDGIYKQGEWIALGQLVCKNCGHKTNVYYALEIPSCSECGHGEFARKALTP